MSARRSLAVLLAVAAAILASSLTGSAASASSVRAQMTGGSHPAHQLAAPTGRARRACPVTAARGHVTCFAMYRSYLTRHLGLQRDATPAGYGPADLQSAYGLPGDASSAGQTVAIVDATNDPDAEADLAVYRAQYSLPPCTTANGCFRQVDQNGGTDYPQFSSNGWDQEISLDLDMVSAACPGCHILLVEADDTSVDNLGTAVNTAVAMGAKYVSNSYGSSYTSQPGSGEDSAETSWDSYYNHPGVAVVASAGDSGYGVAYPAASPYVTSVGGTSLTRDASSARGWKESAWAGTGSGCSTVEPKPAFQRDTGCANRTVADVSADADPSTGVAVYDSYNSGPGWEVLGGTSVAAPLITATYALAGAPASGTYPNSYPYAHSADLNDVTSGTNGSCTTSYLCTAGAGYDGPTGLGTPRGVSAFASGPIGTVSGSITDRANGKPVGGAQLSITGPVSQQVVADPAGDYHASLPPGRYQVTASGYGYATATQSLTISAGDQRSMDVALGAARPAVSVTGQVTDGSGHHWPLYAKVTVAGSGNTAYTDPYTGIYHLQLPANAAYTLQVTPMEPGYQPVNSQLTVRGDTRRDITVPVDAASCTALGYSGTVSGPPQTFDSTQAPPDWSVNSLTSTGWAFSDAYGRGNHTGGSGGFAIADSGNSSNAVQSTLITPPVTLRGMAAPTVAFDSDAEGGSDSVVRVDVSIDDGKTWSTAWSGDIGSLNLTGPQHRLVPLPAFAAGHTVRVRFGFDSNGSPGNYWAVDDVQVGTRRCQASHGGLVVGSVTDATTGQGVDQARVTAGGGTGISVQTDDPAHPHGMYWLFTAPGHHTLTAVTTRRPQFTGDVVTRPDAVTRADVRMASGRLAVLSSGVSGTAAAGGKASTTIQVRNTGTAPAQVTFGSTEPLPSGGAAGTPLKREPARAAVSAPAVTASHAAAAGGDGWTNLAPLPQTHLVSSTSAFDDASGMVYTLGWTERNNRTSNSFSVFDPKADTWSQLASPPLTVGFATSGFVDGELVVAGGFDPYPLDAPLLAATTTVQIYDPATGTWSLGADLPQPLASAAGAVLDNAFYMVGGCGGRFICVPDGGSSALNTVYRYDPVQNTWATVANYPAAVNELACGGVSGELVCTGGNTGWWLFNGGTSATYRYNPAANTWTKGADLPKAEWGAAYTVSGGKFAVIGGITSPQWLVDPPSSHAFSYDAASDTWQKLPDTNTPVYFTSSAACGLVTVGTASLDNFAANQTQSLGGNDSCGTGSDVPWLTTTRGTITIAPGQTRTVTVTMDAGSLPPGDYRAMLTSSTDTPFGISPVTALFTVTPAAGHNLP